MAAATTLALMTAFGSAQGLTSYMGSQANNKSRKSAIDAIGPALQASERSLRSRFETQQANLSRREIALSSRLRALRSASGQAGPALRSVGAIAAETAREEGVLAQDLRGNIDTLYRRGQSQINEIASGASSSGIAAATGAIQGALTGLTVASLLPQGGGGGRAGTAESTVGLTTTQTGRVASGTSLDMMVGIEAARSALMMTG